MDRRWQQIEDLFHAAREVPPATRAAFLDGRCAGDEALRREVESLLARDAESNGPVDGPAWDGVGRLLESTPDLQIAPGTTLGPYRVTGVLGAGGMGQVYRAEDPRLGRTVAIKIARGRFSDRFEREAKAVAALNHPNIAALYDVGSLPSGVGYLVLEYVEGLTLEQRITRGPIPAVDALPIARQIAEALEAAHDAGIVHRDLKPSNIKLKPDDSVKVLDFGLAKALGHDADDAAQAAASAPGMILGTPAYMSPEQAIGKPADRRSDIWSFGVVLYEMLTGQKLFAGATTGEIVEAVITGPLRLDAAPPAWRPLIARCLVRDPRRRLQAIGEARVALEDGLRPERSAPTTVASAGRHWPWIAAGLSVIAIAGTTTVLQLRTAPQQDAPETRLEISAAATNDPRSFSLSPDGRWLAYVAPGGDGQSRLWARSLASAKAQALAVTDGGAAYPFWSPDSRSIGFFSGAKLKRIEVSGGSPQAVADARSGRGGTWNADGVILFDPTPASPLFRVPASGGEPIAVTKLGWAGSHRFPQFLPDGRHFLVYAEGSPEKPGPGLIGSVCLGSLDSGELKCLTSADTAGLYIPSGWLLWVRAGSLVAARLDLDRQQLTGDPVTVADSVFFDSSHARLFSVSATGLIAYRQGAPTLQFTWFDRSGRALGALAPADNDGYVSSSPRISPDGRRVAVGRRVRDTNDIWLLDDSHASRFTFGGGGNPVWSPDGSKIAFQSDTLNPTRNQGTRAQGAPILAKPSDGTQEGVPLVDLPPQPDRGVQDWSRDGRFLIYQSTTTPTGYDLWSVPLEGDHQPRVFLQTRFDEKYARFSPDGHWVVFESNESGRPEIYIRAFTEPTASAQHGGGQWQISLAGGVFPRWRHDGKELYWIGPDGRMMAAPIMTTGTTLKAGAPIALFQSHINGGGLDVNTGGGQFDVAADGRFLINTIVDNASTSITLLQNWKASAR